MPLKKAKLFQSHSRQQCYATSSNCWVQIHRYTPKIMLKQETKILLIAYLVMLCTRCLTFLPPEPASYLCPRCTMVVTKVWWNSIISCSPNITGRRLTNEQTDTHTHRPTTRKHNHNAVTPTNMAECKKTAATNHIGHSQHSTALHHHPHHAFCSLLNTNCRWELVLQAPVQTNTQKYNFVFN